MGQRRDALGFGFSLPQPGGQPGDVRRTRRIGNRACVFMTRTSLLRFPDRGIERVFGGQVDGVPADDHERGRQRRCEHRVAVVTAVRAS